MQEYFRIAEHRGFNIKRKIGVFFAHFHTDHWVNFLLLSFYKCNFGLNSSGNEWYIELKLNKKPLCMNELWSLIFEVRTECLHEVRVAFAQVGSVPHNTWVHPHLFLVALHMSDEDLWDELILIFSLQKKPEIFLFDWLCSTFEINNWASITLTTTDLRSFSDSPSIDTWAGLREIESVYTRLERVDPFFYSHSTISGKLHAPKLISINESADNTYRE